MQARTTATTAMVKVTARVSAGVGHLPQVVGTLATTHLPVLSTLHNPHTVQLSLALLLSLSLKAVRTLAHLSRSQPCPSVLRPPLLRHPRPRRHPTTHIPVRALRTILRLAKICILGSRVGSWRHHKDHQEARTRRSTLLDREPRRVIGRMEQALFRAETMGDGEGECEMSSVLRRRR